MVIKSILSAGWRLLAAMGCYTSGLLLIVCILLCVLDNRSIKLLTIHPALLL